MSGEEQGRFGPYGGSYVAETLVEPLRELAAAWAEARHDLAFKAEVQGWLERYAGRPSLLYRADRLAKAAGVGRLYLKREDLNHTGAHKINNCLGQALLARHLGRRRLIAETGAGQHGVATATVAALFGFPCAIYMGAEDVRRQALNVFRMRLLGAEVRPVKAGSATLKDAMNEALREWVAHPLETHYLVGSTAGPHPYPLMVRDLQAVIGREAREQVLAAEGRLPDLLVACVGGGSNAMGLFHPFIEDPQVALVGVEAAGEGIASGRHAATITRGRPGVLHGSYSLLLQDDHGQVLPAHSLSAGLDYPGVGPEHAWLQESGRARYDSVSDSEALEALRVLSRSEGIIPALESAHAVAWLLREGREGGLADSLVILNLSGRGDKDMAALASVMELGEAGGSPAGERES